MKSGFCFILLLAFAFPGLAAHADQPAVSVGDTPTSAPAAQKPEAPLVVEGWAPLPESGAIESARRSAIDAALVLAVEQRMGATIDSRRTAVNHVLVEDRIQKSVRGEIATYRILEEKPRDGAYWVRLAVELRRDQLRRLGLDQLRVATFILAEPQNWAGGERVRDALAERLTAQGILLLPIEADVASSMTSENIWRIVETINADLLLVVEAERRVAKPMGELQKADVELRAKVYRPAGGELVLSLSAKGEGERRSAIEESARLAIDQAAEALTGKILRGLADQFGRLIARRVIVTGLPTRTEADRIEKALKETPGIHGVRLREFAGHAAFWSVELEPEAARRLADRIQHIPGVDLEVTSEEGGWLCARMPAESGGVEP